MRPVPRARLLVLSALALSVAVPGCFDWDGLLSRCQDAGNCLAPEEGPDASQDGGDGGDGGGGSSDGGDGGAGSDGGIGRLGDPCSGPSACRSDTCLSSTCVCSFGSKCADNSDCCLGEICGLGNNCLAEVVSPCTSATFACNQLQPCCSGTCNAGDMCDPSANGARCNGQNDCQDALAVCSSRGYCCATQGRSCTADDQCCSRVCNASNTCL